jgi:hypothetical protein
MNCTCPRGGEMSKKTKLEKETRRLIEGISELIKRKGDRFKFKTKKKKQIRKIRLSCVHWIMRKGKEMPTVSKDPENPGNWKCDICGASFPIRPTEKVEEFYAIANQFLGYVNQSQFWAVKLGGDKEDTKMFLQLRALIPRQMKVYKNIHKQIQKRQAWDKNRTQTDAVSQLKTGYDGFTYSY